MICKVDASVKQSQRRVRVSNSLIYKSAARNVGTGLRRRGRGRTKKGQ
jgi:hypothetical protein